MTEVRASGPLPIVMVGGGANSLIGPVQMGTKAEVPSSHRHFESRLVGRLTIRELFSGRMRTANSHSSGWHAKKRTLAVRDRLGRCRANDPIITGSPIELREGMPMIRAATYFAGACRRAGGPSRPISASQGPGKRPLPVFSRVNTL